MARTKALPPRVRAAPPRVIAAPKYTDPFYLSQDWRTFIDAIKEVRGYTCEECDKDCRHNKRSLIGDHIVERRDGGADLDQANVILRCASCHNRKTARERMRRSMTAL